MLCRTLILWLAWLQQSSAQSAGAFDAATAGVSSSGVVVNTATGCPEVPLMPRRVTLRRQFWGLRNTITVHDRKGNKILTIRTKYIEWDHLDRFFKFSGANLYTEKEGALAKKWNINAFLTSDHIKIGESSGDPYDLEVKDCQGRLVTKTQNNGIYRAEPVSDDTKSGFFIIKTGAPEANEATIYDLSQPDPKPQVMFKQIEPCWLFPLCTYLVDRGWLAMLPWVAREWHAEVVMKGYGQEIGTLGFDTGYAGDGLQETIGANSAIDIRFLALFSTHIFSASKFSPAQQWFVSIIVGGLFIWCCTRCCFAPPKKEEIYVEHEEEDVYASANPDGTSAYNSPWHCCSRQKTYDSYLRSLNSKKPSELARELQSQRVLQSLQSPNKKPFDQSEIDECLDSADPKASFIEKIKGAKANNMSTRGALE